MSTLYEKCARGDRRTIVRRFQKGKRLELGSSSQFVTFKVDTLAKVTQEFVGFAGWKDVSVDYATAIAAPSRNWAQRFLAWIRRAILRRPVRDRFAPEED